MSDLERKVVKDDLLTTFKKKKVEISRAVTTPSPFLEILQDYSIITEQMYLHAQEEYQRSVPVYNVVYNILMHLEKKFSTEIPEVLFHPINLQEYPPLVQIKKHFDDYESSSEASGSSMIQRSSLDKTVLAVSTPQSSIQDGVLEEEKRASAYQPAQAGKRPRKQRRKVQKTRRTRVVSSKGASNNNKLSKLGRQRKPGTTKKIHWMRRRVFRKVRDPKVNLHLPELPVTCGKAKGTLHKKKMKEGSSEKCIEMKDGRWLTLREFEIEGGRELSKNWKKSIYCGFLTLHHLLQKKILPTPPRKYGKSKKSLPAGKTNRQPRAKKRRLQCKSPSAQNGSAPQPKRRVLQRKQVPEKTYCRLPQLPEKRRVTTLHDRPKYVAQLLTRRWIPVSCKTSAGRLYKHRFASVDRGKCIRTKTKWYTPAEFLSMDPDCNLVFWTHSILSGALPLQELIENNILVLHIDSCTCVICKEEDALPENDDECFICNDGGELSCCNSCPRSFHKDCHIPHIPQEPCGEWNCTFCIITKNKQKQVPENNYLQEESQVLRHRMYPEQQLKCEFLLLKMYCYTESIIFTEDPSYIKNYSNHVREPMWLNLVKERLRDETYNTVEGFVLDMRLIFSNCKKFNKNNQFGILGEKLEAKFERDFRVVFDIEGIAKVNQRWFHQMFP